MKFDFTTESQRAQRRTFWFAGGRLICFFETIGHPGLPGETTANEKHQYFDKMIILDLKSLAMVSESADFFCSSPSPYEQND
jgi:hypothetical protein